MQQLPKAKRQVFTDPVQPLLFRLSPPLDPLQFREEFVERSRAEELPPLFRYLSECLGRITQGLGSRGLIAQEVKDEIHHEFYGNLGEIVCVEPETAAC